MESLPLFLKVPELTKTRTSERSELLKEFLSILKDKNGKPYRPAYLGMRLSHLSVPDLYHLKKICEKSENYGRTFWGSLKVKSYPQLNA